MTLESARNGLRCEAAVGQVIGVVIGDKAESATADLRLSTSQIWVALSGCDSIEVRMITLEPPRRLSSDANPWTAVGTVAAGACATFCAGRGGGLGLQGDVDVLIASDKTLRQLNREFRGKDKATDVLSFPAPKDFPGERAGDLAISLETAARQADAFDHSIAR